MRSSELTLHLPLNWETVSHQKFLGFTELSLIASNYRYLVFHIPCISQTVWHILSNATWSPRIAFVWLTHVRCPTSYCSCDVTVSLALCGRDGEGCRKAKIRFIRKFLLSRNVKWKPIKNLVSLVINATRWI